MRIKRREFITLFGGAAAAWPLAARPQQAAKLPTVGFIGSDTPDAYAVLLRAFRVGLKATGFIEGQNVAIEYGWAEGRNDKLSEFAVDLVRRQVAVIVAPTTPSVLAAKAATKTIPIVFFTAGDPVDLGLVASLSRPDSNLTGATTLTLEVGPKWLQFLHEMVPHATSLALLINPTSPNLAEAQSKALDAAARSRGLQLHVLKASTEQDFGVYTGRVLKGEKLANLPVQQSTKIELFINLKTAEALGLELPATLLTRADDIVE